MRTSRSAEYVFLDGGCLIAEILRKDEGGVVANLYRNPNEFVRDEPIERYAELDFTGVGGNLTRH